MITCTFYGQCADPDYDLPERLLHVIEYVLRQDDDIGFLFYNKFRFSGMAWCAIQLLKRGYPQKHIYLAYLGEENPICEIDDLMQSFNRAVRKQDREKINWCIVNSDILITHLYEPLLMVDLYHLKYAHKKGVRIINIINRKMQEELWENIKHIKPREQDIIELIRRGEHPQFIAEKYQLNPKSIRQIYDKGVVRLRKLLLNKSRLRHPLDCYGNNRNSGQSLWILYI